MPVDTRLLGKWNSDQEAYNDYTVSQATALEYRIIQKNISNTTRFTGFLSEVKGSLFMNVYSDSTRTYYLYRVRTDSTGSRFTLTPVADNLPDHFGSIDALRNYVEKNMNLKSFYNEADQAEFYKSAPATSKSTGAGVLN